MKARLWLCIALLLAVSAPLAAQDKSKGKPAMDPKEMEAMMAQLAAPGPNHEVLKKLEGEWNQTVVWTMDPSQPTQETKSTATVKTIMGGRYCQEETTGEMMGQPFNGMGITGYDNVTKKFVSTWIDNMGTGIMTSEGTMDASGKVINWTGTMSDPMTGKASKVRMVTRMVDDNKHTFEMYTKDPKSKEYKMMEITYDRKM